MTFKRRLHHVLVTIRRIKTWQLVVALILLATISAFWLRQNNLEMVKLRDVVDQADQNSGDVKAALLNLQHYVTSHMNTSLGDGIALQGSYARAYQAAVDAAASSTNPNAQDYTAVELACRPVYQRTHSFPAYTACAHDQLSQLSPGQDPLASIKTPAPELFRYNYISPLWSADLAGFSLLITVLIGLIILTKLLMYIIIRVILKIHR